jgi:hypothetical protein
MKTREQLEKMNTTRLLGYRNKLLRVHETPDWEYPNGYSKQSKEWIEEYELVKEILNTRENVK